jgi:hypothetical protein
LTNDGSDDGNINGDFTVTDTPSLGDWLDIHARLLDWIEDGRIGPFPFSEDEVTAYALGCNLYIPIDVTDTTQAQPNTDAAFNDAAGGLLAFMAALGLAWWLARDMLGATGVGP